MNMNEHGNGSTVATRPDSKMPSLKFTGTIFVFFFCGSRWRCGGMKMRIRLQSAHLSWKPKMNNIMYKYYTLSIKR